jgi:hypothetical protein
MSESLFEKSPEGTDELAVGNAPVSDGQRFDPEGVASRAGLPPFQGEGACSGCSVGAAHGY